MKNLDINNKNFDKILHNLLFRRKSKIKSSLTKVTNILKDVRKNGDRAVLKFEKRFSKNNLIVPSKQKITKTISLLDTKVKNAIDVAYNRIYKFHSLQKFRNISYTDNLKNKLDYKYIPIDSVGIYVPGPTILSTFLIFLVP